MAEFFADVTNWIQPYTKDIVPFKLRVNTYNGRVIGIPFDLDPALLYYREDLLQKAGVDPTSIQTYGDLITAAKQIQGKLGKDKKPIHIERANWAIPLQLEMFANQQGTSLVNEKGELQLNSDPYLKAVKWIKSVLDNQLGSLQEYTSPGDIQAMETDQVAFYPWAIWFVYAPDNLLKTTKGKWRAMPLPAWSAGGPRGANMGGSSFVIPKQSKNAQLAWLFYEHLMFSPDGYKAVYGPNKIYPGGLNTSLSSYLPAQKDQLFQNPEGLGNQNLWQVATSTVKDIPADYYYATWYGKAADIIAANIQHMQDGQMSAEDAIKKSADDITAKVINR
jgi:lactose/L-arabinose transport system substrate-binding protein